MQESFNNIIHDDRYRNIMTNVLWQDYQGPCTHPYTPHCIAIANMSYARRIPVGEAAEVYAEMIGDVFDYNDPTHQAIFDASVWITGELYNGAQ